MNQLANFVTIQINEKQYNPQDDVVTLLKNSYADLVKLRKSYGHAPTCVAEQLSYIITMINIKYCKMFECR